MRGKNKQKKEKKSEQGTPKMGGTQNPQERTQNPTPKTGKP